MGVFPMYMGNTLANGRRENGQAFAHSGGLAGEIDDERTSARAGGVRVREAEFAAELSKEFRREESDLALVALVILLVAEEAVATNALAGDALDFLTLQYRMLAGRLFVVAEIVVAGRNEQVAHTHQAQKRYCRPVEMT